MSQKTQYFKIGLFILIGSSILVAGIIVLGAGKIFEKKIYVETYFSTSVQGIDIGTPIKCRGVKIGKVDQINIVGDAYDFGGDMDKFRKYGLYVRVRGALKIGAISLITQKLNQKEIDHLVQNEGLRLKMVPLGITGLSYLELDFGNGEYPLMDIIWKPKLVYIPSVPNEFEMFIRGLMTFSKSMNEDIKPILENLREASKSFPETTKNINKGLGSVSELSTNLNSAVINANKIMGENQQNLKETMNNIKFITNDLRDVSQELKNNPSRVIFGEAPPKQGVER